MVTIWSCPAWRDIDVDDPNTFMDQSSAGPNSWRNLFNGLCLSHLP